jgi:ribosomal protein L40E
MSGEAAEAKRNCPKCGAVVAPEARSCVKCGELLKPKAKKKRPAPPKMSWNSKEIGTGG